ncbi:hypothetical protein ACVWYG_002348 [Pedobacter sp. UYEF25]
MLPVYIKNLLGTSLHWLFVEARKMRWAEQGKTLRQKKYQPERSDGRRFICPDPKGSALTAGGI